MTGHYCNNFVMFDASEQMLKRAGLCCVNPWKLNSLYPGRDDLFYRRESMKLLLNCNAIYMIKGWEASVGAKHEYEVSKYLKFIEIVFDHNDGEFKETPCQP